MKPKICYTVWFSQRNGSSLLCEALKATGIAGKPGEWLELPRGISLLDFYQAKDYSQLQDKLWLEGMTSNSVFGLKANAPIKENDSIIKELAQFPDIKSATATHYNIWKMPFLMENTSF